MPKVALMCGHGKSKNGSWDCGTTYAGYDEASLMLPITKAAVKYLRSYGVTVISDADTNNNKNMLVDVEWANKEKTDIYVSIHCDYYKAVSGVMPLYVSEKGKKLATALNDIIRWGIPMKSRGVVKRTDLWELNGTDMPACILETGSIKADLAILRDKPDEYGKLIAQGICIYLGVDYQQGQQPAESTQPVQELYRVRKSWADASSQVGAYQNLENAKLAADVNGYNVYKSDGTLVYQGKKKESAPAMSTTETNAEKICKLAKEYAYSANTSTSKSNVKTGKPKEAYKKALNIVFPNRSNWSEGPKKGASCDVFLAVIIRITGIDKNYPRGLSPDYTGKSGKFKKVSKNDVKPGDIIFGSDHVCIVVGNGKVAEAASGGKELNYKGRFYPKITNNLESYLKTAKVIYRAK